MTAEVGLRVKGKCGDDGNREAEHAGADLRLSATTVLCEPLTFHALGVLDFELSRSSVNRAWKN